MPLAALLLGAAVGATAPFADRLCSMATACRCRRHLGIYPVPLLLAAAFGLLSAVAFAVPPLARARAIPPASLLRDTVAPGASGRPESAIAATGAARRWRSRR